MVGWYRRLCCFSSRNKKPIQGWLSRSSFFTYNISCSLNPRPSFSKSRVSQPTLWKSARFQSIHPFLNGAGAKRFYHVDRYKVSHFRRLTRIAFLVVSGVVISAYYLILTFLKDECTETVPYTKRSRMVLVDQVRDKERSSRDFEEFEARFRDKLLPLDHPESIRIRGIAHNINDALHRDLKRENHETKKLMGLRDEILDDQGSKCDRRHHWEGLVLEFMVLDGPVRPCNIFGSKIVVSRGLLDCLTSDAEIATIVGHEVAHVVARHLAEKATKMALWSVHTPFFLCCLIDRSNITYAANFIERFHIMNFLERFPFSRLELEADYIGMMLMASAGYDPRVAPQVYEKLGEINNNNNYSTSLELISRHPHAKTRVKLLTRAEVMKEALCRYREAQCRQMILLYTRRSSMQHAIISAFSKFKLRMMTVRSESEANRRRPNKFRSMPDLS